MNHRINQTAQASSIAVQIGKGDTKSGEEPPSLAILWARQYIDTVKLRRVQEHTEGEMTLEEADAPAGRLQTTTKLRSQINLASAKAWSQSEQLLSESIRHHGIDTELISPLKIASDSSNLFHQAFKAYADGISPYNLSVQIGQLCGQIRQHYTADDPRAVGIFSMQFHYTGKALLNLLSLPEKALLEPYLKVMDDHMYMPLQACYLAAAKQPLTSPVLDAVQALLPISTEIANVVCDYVIEQHPGYQCYSGPLDSPAVRTSSLRDVEMFQIYLCLCALENNINTVQQELFPLCAMLYPPLQVEWFLVQDMLKGLSWEFLNRLHADHLSILLPYVQILTEMFSDKVFEA